MTKITHKEQLANNLEFEAEVRNTAEAIWNLEPGECQPEHYSDNPIIRELDGIANVDGVTHLIMATVSKRLDKAKADIRKLNEAQKIESKKAAGTVKWFITREQLDAEHIGHAKANNVNTFTLTQFKRKFYDGRDYIAKRSMYSFGSARNPKDDTINIDNMKIVALPLVEECVIQKNLKEKQTQRLKISLDDIARKIKKGEHVVLLAPFGSGKSITTAKLFKLLCSDYLKGDDDRSAICINLREHWKQEYYDEILERHARAIGVKKKESLVTAWRSSLAHLLMDGFDEVASQAFIRSDDRSLMKEARLAALSGVRDFITKIPQGIGIFLCGRDHYFDHHHEMEHALGLSGKIYSIVYVDELDEQTAREYLQVNGVSTELPSWLPRKPLLLSYLISNNLLDDIMQIDSSAAYGYAWDTFIQNISDREAALEKSAMESRTIRLVMEHLAWIARGTAKGDGPITGTDLSHAYKAVTNQPAGDAVIAQLQRLPVLAVRNEEIGSRSFIDQDILWSLQGSTLANFILSGARPYDINLIHPLGMNAISMATYIAISNGANHRTAISIAKRLLREKDQHISNQHYSQIAADCVLVAIEIAIQMEMTAVDCEGVVLEGVEISCIDLEQIAINNLEVHYSNIKQLSLGMNASESNLSFHNCSISKVSGVSKESLIPKNICMNCETSELDNTNTTSSIMSLPVTPQMKALLTVLKKVFKQSGGGRKTSALYRGITDKSVYNHIGQIIEVLKSYGYITILKDVAHPARDKSSIVDSIIGAPSYYSNDLIEKVLSL